jgi:hypothetical protein
MNTVLSSTCARDRAYYALPVFMDSGPGLMGRPGMTRVDP